MTHRQQLQRLRIGGALFVLLALLAPATAIPATRNAARAPKSVKVVLATAHTLALGKLTDRSKRATSPPAYFRALVAAKLLHMGRALRLAPAAPAGNLELRGTITRSTRSYRRGRTSIGVTVSLVVTSAPRGVIVTASRGEARVIITGKTTRGEEVTLRRDALAAAVDEAFAALSR